MQLHLLSSALLLCAYCLCVSANVVTFGMPDVQQEICYKKRILKGLRNPVVFTFDNPLPNQIRYIRVEAPPHRYNTELAVKLVRGDRIHSWVDHCFYYNFWNYQCNSSFFYFVNNAIKHCFIYN
uniref:Farnesoic acid O-methyl transferase domain-containing protein n=1 Tax=Anopheles maculatus TaxID=74869 RepID=A0A182SXZ8_9DIPT